MRKEPSGFCGHISSGGSRKSDAIVVGIAQVERLGDAVIGGALESDACDDQPA